MERSFSQLEVECQSLRKLFLIEVQPILVETNNLIFRYLREDIKEPCLRPHIVWFVFRRLVLVFDLIKGLFSECGLQYLIGED